jgi:hypothetical protein
MLFCRAAEVIAKKFHGYGPKFYQWTKAEWMGLLGQNGRGFYLMMLG